MITLWIVRHGLSDWNVQKRYLGQSDIELNTTGYTQALQIGKRLATERIHAIFSSDLQRTQHTAEQIANHHKIDVQLDANLREAHFGIFEGLRYKDVIQEYKMMAERWFTDPEHPPTDGEQFSQVTQRIITFTDRILKEYPRKRLVVVGHDGALRLLICTLLAMPPSEYWRFNLDAGSLTRVNIYPGGAILIRLNDVGHLRST